MTAALLAEWTKLRTVRRWAAALLGAAVLIVGLGLLASSSGGTDANVHRNFVVGPDGQPVSDEFEFVHRPLSGDGSITVRVASLADNGVDAAAGLMLKDGLTPGSRYVSLFAARRTGVHLSQDYDTDVRGPAGAAPVWLRLTRAGNTVTGEQSADGTAWTRVAKVTAAALPRDVLVGLFVSSPADIKVERQPGGTSVGERPTLATATFDGVAVTGASGEWAGGPVEMPRGNLVKDPPPPGADRGNGEPPAERDGPSFAEQGGTFTVKGRGEIGPKAPPDDPISVALFGVLAGAMALVSVAALFVTAEYRRGMIRTTFIAEPRRGLTLAAKAVVIGAVSYVVALAGGAAVLLLARPRLIAHGYGPPAFPRYSLADWPVLRTLLLTAAFLALIAVFATAVGAIVRHSAAAITTVIALLVLPVIIGSVVPFGLARWVMLLTPAGGLATWRAKPPDDTLADPTALIGSLAGLASTGAYAAGALILAWWLLRRRDA
ncbi:MAG TPA: hypothetical protein VL738_29085 [Dactylosporangium sp.]|nr:hypothetical protein [Dactylosporangium sp.]